MAANDTPPLDTTVIATIEGADGGITVVGLIGALEAQGYPRNDVIRAIQRVLDRGLAELGDSAKVLATKERLPEAA